MQLINNLATRLNQNQDQIKTAIARVLDSGWLILGPECKEFEQRFADYLGVSYCIGVANGTDAIELGLKALGIGKNDLVATVANAGMYTTSAVLSIGAAPFFMDVDLETKNTNLAEVKRAIAAGVKAVVITHLYGLAVADVKEIAAYCKNHKIPLFEDCAQAHGAQIDHAKVGSFGDAASFSFYPTKNLGALGDGGAVVTNHLTVAEQVRLLSQYGWTAKYKVSEKGARNSRLDEIQAAILSTFLPHLDNANSRRREISAQYSEMINHPALLLPPISGNNYVAHLYVIRSPQRELLREYLISQKIASDVHYPIPDYRQPIFEHTYADIHLPNTEILSAEILTLPCYPEMSDSEVAKVISAVNGWQA